MEIAMPKLGESVHEGTIEQWLVSVGDHIDEYEPLCEVITDKVTAEVPSTISGTITEILVEAGQTVAIDTIICKIETADEKTNETTEEIQAKVDEDTQKSTKELVQQWNRHLLLNKINHEIMVAIHLLYLNSLQSMTLIYHKL